MCIRDRFIPRAEFGARGQGDARRRVGAQAVGVDAVVDDGCLLYTSDAADERSSVDLGGRRIIKKKNISSDGERSTRHRETNEPNRTHDRLTKPQEAETSK